MKFNVVSVFDPQGSLGHIGEHIVRALVGRKHDVRAVHLDACASKQLVNAGLPNFVAKRLGPPMADAKTVLQVPIGFPRWTDWASEADVVFTIWETDKLPARDVRLINKAGVAVTYTQWGAEVMRQSGVTVPIFVTHLGFRKDYGLGTNLPSGKKFVTMGRSWSGHRRKGLHNVIAAFNAHSAFHADTELIIKSTPHDTMTVASPRVTHIKQYMPATELAKLYGDCVAYVSGATAEGWGWHQMEAMACGRPLIAANWGGLTEFFKPPRHGYDLRYRMVEAKDEFHDCGQWTAPSIDDMVLAMNAVAENPHDALMRGMQAHIDMQAYTEKAMLDGLADVIEANV